ncbi:hypothetical protein AAC387_Pa03g2722 [Persea americana]
MCKPIKKIQLQRLDIASKRSFVVDLQLPRFFNNSRLTPYSHLVFLIRVIISFAFCKSPCYGIHQYRARPQP